MSDLAVVPATADDVRSLARLRRSDDVAFGLTLEAADDGSVWVARDGREPIGIAVARAGDAERYVGDLYVAPSYRGQGVGGRLLDAALGDAGDAARRLLLPGGDPAGLALAVGRGLSPVATLVGVSGAIPREDALLSMAAGHYRFAVEAVDAAADAFALDALDRETRGVARPAAHARFARAATGLAFFLDGEFVAYAYVWPNGRVGPVAAASAAYLTQIFSYAMVALQRRTGASWCTLLIPGTALRVLRPALGSGLRIDASFALASDEPMADLSRCIGFHPLAL